jgi:hypothetical protein
LRAHGSDFGTWIVGKTLPGISEAQIRDLLCFSEGKIPVLAITPYALEIQCMTASVDALAHDILALDGFVVVF